MFWSKNKKTYHMFYLKIIDFTAVKYCSILHWHVFVMKSLLVSHCVSTPMQYKCDFYGNFQMKNCDFFLFCSINIKFGYLLDEAV